MSNIEKTLSIIKPDAVERNLQDEIKNEFKNKGFDMLREKNTHNQGKAERFYKVHDLNHFIMICVHIYPLDLSLL